MTIDDWNVFKKDYDLLIKARSLSSWNNAYKYKSSVYIDKLSYFNKLHNKYNYTSFKKSIIHSEEYNLIIEIAERNGCNNDEIVCLCLSLTISIYIGFLIEWILVDCLRKQGHIVIKNPLYDRKGKIDFLCDNKKYQVKSITFIDNSHFYELNNQYNGKELNYIFYTIEEENIYFVSIDNKPFINTDFDKCIAFCEIKNVCIDCYLQYFRKE